MLAKYKVPCTPAPTTAQLMWQMDVNRVPATVQGATAAKRGVCSGGAWRRLAVSAPPALQTGRLSTDAPRLLRLCQRPVLSGDPGQSAAGAGCIVQRFTMATSKRPGRSAGGPSHSGLLTAPRSLVGLAQIQGCGCSAAVVSVEVAVCAVRGTQGCAETACVVKRTGHAREFITREQAFPMLTGCCKMQLYVVFLCCTSL